jgi:regulatory protein
MLNTTANPRIEDGAQAPPPANRTSQDELPHGSRASSPAPPFPPARNPQRPATSDQATTPAPDPQPRATSTHPTSGRLDRTSTTRLTLTTPISGIATSRNHASADPTPLLITAIERSPTRRARLDIYVDGVRTFDVARSTLSTHRLRPGRPITPDEIAAIVASEQRRLALDAAVAMLARRPCSERDVRQRLARRRFDPALIDDTIRKLHDAKLLDDAAYARSFTESRDRTSPRGRRLLVQELRAHGVAAAVAADAVAGVSDADAAYRVAARKLRSLAALDYQTFRNRLGSLLQRRGFGWEICKTTVDRCWRELGRGVSDAKHDDFDVAVG